MLRRSILLTGCVAAVACVGNPKPVVETTPPGKPKLVVLIVADQLREDLLDQYGDLFTGGFKRLRVQGHSYVNATHEHAVTETAPGHATLATGVYPSRHGIVWNEWYTKQNEKWVQVTNISDSTEKIVGLPGASGFSPRNVMRDGLADWILAANAHSIVASVSGKDRGAIQPVAHAKGYVYWFDRGAGKFVTSTYYRTVDPDWITTFNDNLQQRFRSDSVWSSNVPQSFLARSDKDTVATEGDGTHTAFPHTYGSESTSMGYWWWWSATPDLDVATIDLAQTMVTSLGLGRDDIPDFLNVSASATDRVGHEYGPDSREQLDNLLRLDKELGSFFDFLDRTVGKNQWTVMLTADHGVLDSPEDLQARGEYSHRLTAADRAKLDSLRQEADRSTDPAAAAIKLRDDLKKLPIVADAWTHQQLATEQPADSFEVMQQHSMWPGREAGMFSREGVELRFVPGVIANVRGTTHGTSYFYDRHVPMIFMGPGIAPGRDSSHAATVDFAPTFARILGIPYPNDLDGHPLSAVSSH